MTAEQEERRREGEKRAERNGKRGLRGSMIE